MTAFLKKKDFLHLMHFQIRKIPKKKATINRGIRQEMNVFRMNIESANKLALKFARKQSNEIMVSVVCPS